MSCIKHIHVAQEVFIFDQTQRCMVLQSVFFETVLVHVWYACADHIQCTLTSTVGNCFHKTGLKKKMFKLDTSLVHNLETQTLDSMVQT